MEAFEFNIDWGLNTLLRLLDSYQFQAVLDVGSGEGEHSRLLRHWGKEVFSVDLHEKAGYYLTARFEKRSRLVPNVCPPDQGRLSRPETNGVF